MPDENKAIAIPIEWDVPGNLVARYATNMVVQRLENEFLISFFEVKPPIIVGESDTIAEKVREIKSIHSNCVAQIIVAADKMPSFVTALEKTLGQPLEHVDDVEVK